MGSSASTSRMSSSGMPNPETKFEVLEPLAENDHHAEMEETMEEENLDWEHMSDIATPPRTPSPVDSYIVDDHRMATQMMLFDDEEDEYSNLGYVPESTDEEDEEESREKRLDRRRKALNKPATSFQKEMSGFQPASTLFRPDPQKKITSFVSASSLVSPKKLESTPPIAKIRPLQKEPPRSTEKPDLDSTFAFLQQIEATPSISQISHSDTLISQFPTSESAMKDRSMDSSSDLNPFVKKRPSTSTSSTMKKLPIDVITLDDEDEQEIKPEPKTPSPKRLKTDGQEKMNLRKYFQNDPKPQSIARKEEYPWMKKETKSFHGEEEKIDFGEEEEKPGDESGVVEKFKRLNVVLIAEALRSMRFSVGTKRVLIIAIVLEKLDNLNMIDDEWTLKIRLIDESQKPVICILSHQLLCQLMGMTPSQAVAIKTSKNKARMSDGQSRIQALYSQLERLDLLFEIEFFAANGSIPIVHKMETFAQRLLDD